jgi:hypothetical protein
LESGADGSEVCFTAEAPDLSCGGLLETCFARGSRVATMEMLEEVWARLQSAAGMPATGAEDGVEDGMQ